MDTAREAEAILRGVGGQPDESIDLGMTALALGALDRPRVGLARYRDHLDQLARDTMACGQGADDAASRIAALRAALVERHGYAGDTLTYDDPQNANLLRVIDRRRGLPVALGILYIATARRLGWTMVGLNFPGHFVVRLECGAERAILDPFHGGRVREPAELRGLVKAAAGETAELEAAHYAPVSNRAVLLRLQNNIKLRRFRAGDAPGALAVVERMLLIAPDVAELHREAGMLHGHLGNIQAAIAALADYIARETDEASRHRAAVLLQNLRSKLH